MSVQCPECFSEVSSNAVKCLTCGFPTSKSKKSSVELNDLNPLMIAYQSPIARENVVLFQPKLKPTIIKSIEDEEPSEDGLHCIQCGGGIATDDINCSHCKTLIMRRYCSHCSKLIPDHATICPLCKKDVREHFSYSKLRRTKILIGAGTAAFFVFVVMILFLQKTAPKTTIAEADAIKKQELQLSGEKGVEVQKTVTPEPPQVHEIVPPPTATKIEPSTKVEKPIETIQVEPQIKIKPGVKESEPEPEPQKLAKMEESKQKVEEPKQIEKVEQPKQIAKVQQSPVRPMLYPALQRAVDLKSQQRVLKARSLNHKGYTLIRSGRPYDAIPVLEQAVRSYPENKRDLNYAYALFNLAVAYRMAGKPEMAIPLLQERIKINDQRDVVARELNSAKREARLSGLSENDLN